MVPLFGISDETRQQVTTILEDTPLDRLVTASTAETLRELMGTSLETNRRMLRKVWISRKIEEVQDPATNLVLTAMLDML